MSRLTAQPTNDALNVLVIDDDERYVRSMTRLLGVAGCVTRGETQALAGVALAKAWRPDVALIDYFMPDLTGEEVIAQIRTFDDCLPCLVVSGYAGGREVDLVDNPDVQALFGKAENPKRLVASVRMWGHASRLMRARAVLPATSRPLLEMLTELLAVRPVDRFRRATEWFAEALGQRGAPTALVVANDGRVLAALGDHQGAPVNAVSARLGLHGASLTESFAWRHGHVVLSWGTGTLALRAPEPVGLAADVPVTFRTVFETLQAAMAIEGP